MSPSGSTCKAARTAAPVITLFCPPLTWNVTSIPLDTSRTLVIMMSSGSIVIELDCLTMGKTV